MPRLLFAFIVPFVLFAVACGGGDSSATGAATAAPAPRDGAERFVFGASPGKPVIYWIHTEW